MKETDLLFPVRNWTLQNIEDGYRQGLFAMDVVNEFLRQWNATPCRFTFAFWRDGIIKQREKS